MNFEYYYPKKDFSKFKIEKVCVFLKNGESFQLHKSEVRQVDVTLCDRLVRCGKGTAPLVDRGTIGLSIRQEHPPYDASVVCDEEAYQRDRKQYIEQRLAEEMIDRVHLYDENNWHDVLLGDICAVREADGLTLKFMPNPRFGPAEQTKSSIRLRDIPVESVFSIGLDFENCESFDIWPSEILDMRLWFCKKLVWEAYGYNRRLRGGYIRWKPNPRNLPRTVHLFNEWQGRRTQGVAPLIRRLCDKGADEIDICHLYVTYKYPGDGVLAEECISVDDLRPNDVVEQLDEAGCLAFTSGYARRLKDGSVLIVFGKELPQKWRK